MTTRECHCPPDLYQGCDHRLCDWCDAPWTVGWSDLDCVQLQRACDAHAEEWMW